MEDQPADKKSIMERIADALPPEFSGPMYEYGVDGRLRRVVYREGIEPGLSKDKEQAMQEEQSAADRSVIEKMLALGSELSKFLDCVKDQGTHIDSGSDFRSRDLFVTVGGVEWRINISAASKAEAA